MYMLKIMHQKLLLNYWQNSIEFFYTVRKYVEHISQVPVFKVKVTVQGKKLTGLKITAEVNSIKLHRNILHTVRSTYKPKFYVQGFQNSKWKLCMSKIVSLALLVNY